MVVGGAAVTHDCSPLSSRAVTGVRCPPATSAVVFGMWKEWLIGGSKRSREMSTLDIMQNIARKSFWINDIYPKNNKPPNFKI